MIVLTKQIHMCSCFIKIVIELARLFSIRLNARCFFFLVYVTLTILPIVSGIIHMFEALQNFSFCFVRIIIFF